MAPGDAIFGQAVRELRSERGLTQESLAFEVPVTVSHISKIERGKVSPRWETVTKIAAGLGVAPVELVARAEAIGKTTSEPSL